ncbi:cysteine desulfurase-like protein [Agarivorans sp. 1_MG-2023]|uniref:cysteine desulfurase-like protein n=1 Tax=Agarivorans sp. 1_MG-2023 TaxID=3062634 RepID=UPI0026E40F9F|nr:cysteine desulfurase-like protein [Agarivorans sp. 1_MG-2023]MDO6762717.1 cysteine desulfurase-like protein [Agarivorans sp. 1_MG-2023]
MSFSFEQARLLFPALAANGAGHTPVFLDGPGGSQVPSSVIQAMADYLLGGNSNLGGAFSVSKRTEQVLQTGRESAQALLNAPSANNIIFDANMTSLTFKLSRAISRDWNSDDEVIVSRLDHYSNVSSWQHAAADKGARVHNVNIDPQNCNLDYQHFESLINPNTRLVAITYASNTSGSIVDLQRVIVKAKSVGAMVYVDAVHYVPHGLVDVQALGCDFLVCSAYKFFGPHLGIAYVADPWLEHLEPYKVEPATNIGPGRFETGTQSFEAIAGMTAAVEYLAHWNSDSDDLRSALVKSYQQFNAHEQALSHHFLERLSKHPHAQLYGESSNQRLANRTATFSLRWPNHAPEQIAGMLADHNIATWHGHFYAQGMMQQLDILDKGGVLRIGFMHYNTHQEIDQLWDLLDQYCL